MTTEWSQSDFGFDRVGGREVVARFDGGDITVSELIAQRVYGLALGYEDLIYHDRLRHDPLFGVPARLSLSGKSVVFIIVTSAGLPEKPSAIKRDRMVSRICF
jgi:hypothetical protein